MGFLTAARFFAAVRRSPRRRRATRSPIRGSDPLVDDPWSLVPGAISPSYEQRRGSRERSCARSLIRTARPALRTRALRIT